MSETKCQEIYRNVQDAFKGHIVGNEELIELLFIAYLARGHILLEGPPGTGKTLAAKVFSGIFCKQFKRIQFTSDLLPSDIIGCNIFLPGQSGFKFLPGPLFADVVLADEINRSPPRTQSALLEAMEERQVSIENECHRLSSEFFVVATQNSLEHEGTFPLPDAQLDRFFFKLKIHHGTANVDAQIICQQMEEAPEKSFDALTPVSVDRRAIDEELRSVKMNESLFDYLARILEKTRNHPMVQQGCSVRGGLALARAARLRAKINGRDYVIPDDIKVLGPVTLRHRIRLHPEADLAEGGEDQVIEEILAQVDFPA